MPKAYPAYGPKLFSQRQPFRDQATNSRCITWEANGGTPRDDIPIYLDHEMIEVEARLMRNMLLMYRMRKWTKHIDVDFNAGDKRLPGRLREVTVALKAVAPDLAGEIDGFMLQVKDQLLAERRNQLEAKVLHAILRCYYAPEDDAKALDGKLKLATKFVARVTNELIDEENDFDAEEESFSNRKKVRPNRITPIVRNKLNLGTARGTVGTKPVCVIWDDERVLSLVERYGMRDILDDLRDKANGGSKGQMTPDMSELPPSLVMTTTAGRGGILGSKSGQRVAGSSKVLSRSKPGMSLVPAVPGGCTATKSVSPSSAKRIVTCAAPTLPETSTVRSTSRVSALTSVRLPPA